ncbi:MAG: heme ABC transporter ATP-binding protein CcmA, partial [Pseudomonas sp.]
EQGGLVVMTTHHSLSEKPSGYIELDLGRRAA